MGDGYYKVRAIDIILKLKKSLMENFPCFCVLQPKRFICRLRISLHSKNVWVHNFEEYFTKSHCFFNCFFNLKIYKKLRWIFIGNVNHLKTTGSKKVKINLKALSTSFSYGACWRQIITSQGVLRYQVLAWDSLCSNTLNFPKN